MGSFAGGTNGTDALIKVAAGGVGDGDEDPSLSDPLEVKGDEDGEEAELLMYPDSDEDDSRDEELERSGSKKISCLTRMVHDDSLSCNRNSWSWRGQKLMGKRSKLMLLLLSSVHRCCWRVVNCGGCRTFLKIHWKS